MNSENENSQKDVLNVDINDYFEEVLVQEHGNFKFLYRCKNKKCLKTTKKKHQMKDHVRWCNNLKYIQCLYCAKSYKRLY